MLVELVGDANAAGVIEVADARKTSQLVLRTVIYSWFGNRLASSARVRITAEDTWQFLLNGLKAKAALLRLEQGA